MNKWLIPALLFAFSTAAAYAEDDVTPYGDNCPLCGDYGYCDKQPSHKEAVTALKSYYGKKGLNVVVKKSEGRFVEAVVYRDGTVVDRILLDVMTGRIRSIIY